MAATTPVRSQPVQARVPCSPKTGGLRAINPVLARYPPTPMTAVVRSASYEALGSRGVSPVPIAVAAYHTTSLTSPPLSHRSGSQVDSARGQRVHAVPRRLPSRSPPPQRSATETNLRAPSRNATPRAMAKEPIAVRVSTAPHPMQVATASAQSTQSLPSAASLGSGPVLPPAVAAMPTTRALSTSSLAAGPPFPVAVQTLTAQPPWATVLAAPARPDNDELREKLDQIQQEVRTMSLRQLEQGTGDRDALENTKKRLNEIVNNQQQQLAQNHKDPAPVEQDQRLEELHAQLAQKDAKLVEVEQRLYQATEELEYTKGEMSRVRSEYDTILNSKVQLENEQRSSRELREQSDANCEQLRARCEELHRSELDLQERVRVLSNLKTSLEAQASEQGERERRLADSARRMEGEKRLLEARGEQLEAELETARAQLQQHQEVLAQQAQVEHETRELRCCTAVLEDQLRDAQERRERAEQEQQRAEADLRQWYQKFLEVNKENSALQRTNQAQVKQLWELENQLRQERNIGKICTPGEYLRMAKAHEDSSLAGENARLKKAVTKLQCEVDLCVRKLSDQEKLLKEYQESNKRFQG